MVSIWAHYGICLIIFPIIITARHIISTVHSICSNTRSVPSCSRHISKQLPCIRMSRYYTKWVRTSRSTYMIMSRVIWIICRLVVVRRNPTNYFITPTWSKYFLTTAVYRDRMYHKSPTLIFRSVPVMCPNRPHVMLPTNLIS